MSGRYLLVYLSVMTVGGDENGVSDKPDYFALFRVQRRQGRHHGKSVHAAGGNGAQVRIGQRVEHRLEEGAIGYTIKFKLLLDFEAFKVAANAAIPGYLDSFINAIRPELGGLAYHLWYNYFSDAAGKIHSFSGYAKFSAGRAITSINGRRAALRGVMRSPRSRW